MFIVRYVCLFTSGWACDAHRRALGVGAVRRVGPAQVAVRRLVQRRHHRKQAWVGRNTRVGKYAHRGHVIHGPESIARSMSSATLERKLDCDNLDIAVVSCYKEKAQEIRSLQGYKRGTLIGIVRSWMSVNRTCTLALLQCLKQPIRSHNDVLLTRDAQLIGISRSPINRLRKRDQLID